MSENRNSIAGTRLFFNRDMMVSLDKKKAKLLNVPIVYIDTFKTIKESGFTSLTFSSYLIEALKEKIINDMSRLNS